MAVGADLFAVSKSPSSKSPGSSSASETTSNASQSVRTPAVLRWAAFERFQVVMAMIEDDAREGDKRRRRCSSRFTVAHGLADDFGDGGGPDVHAFRSAHHRRKGGKSCAKGEITLDAALLGLAADGQYKLAGTDHRRTDHRQQRQDRGIHQQAIQGRDLKDGRIAFTEKWKPEQALGHPHPTEHVRTPAVVAGRRRQGTGHGPPGPLWVPRVLDRRPGFLPERHAASSSRRAARQRPGRRGLGRPTRRREESLQRLKSFGINFVYTHNYGCEPGSHLSFAEILRAADDVGMLVSFSQPHFGHYDWKAADADQNNGYARHAEFYVRVAQNHPSVVFYSMSHNATGYDEDMNPDMIDGMHDPREQWSRNNASSALRAEAIVKRLDPSRIVYHHSSGNLGSMHTSNFYPNFAPIQELSDWFEHWATEGVKPMFTCEYGAPFTWDWTMYRGWYKGTARVRQRQVPWEFCFAEWNAQFLGDRAFKISEPEKANLRWEAKQFRAGKLWHRWDYPFEIGSPDFDDRQTGLGHVPDRQLAGLSHLGRVGEFALGIRSLWKLRDGVERGRKELKVDWENLQRPGFSPDYIDRAATSRWTWPSSVPTGFPRPPARPCSATTCRCWPTSAASPHFTSKDHIFLPGETVEKQLIIINNSPRRPVTCDCQWSLDLPDAVTGGKKVNVATGEQERIPLQFELPEP